MSAIWGHVDFNKIECPVESMAAEYRRKCRLDGITETPFKNVLFGFGSQRVNPEDEFEAMPYIIEEGNTILTADCILDNRDELIEQLCKGEDASRIPDGRLVSLSYEKWRTDFVSHIQGIFSVAVYNFEKKTLFLCTDRTSSRCLYYCKKDGSCSFSTLISPIKKLHPELKQNDMYIKDYLLLPGLMPNITSTETPWEDIYIIEAGCSVTITEASVEQKRYWEPEKQELPKDIGKLKEIFLTTYRDAVKRALRTGDGVGMALSGGFDSASIAAMAAPLLKEQGKDLISYTYVPYFDMSKQYPKRMITNESGYVQEIAKMYPNIETNYVNNDGKSFIGYIDELVDVMEIPFKAFVNLPQLLEIYRAARDKGCKVFLNGQSGNASVSFGDISEVVYELYRKKHYAGAFRYFNNYCKLAGVSRKTAFPSILNTIRQQKSCMNVQEELDPEDISPFVDEKLLEGYSLAERNKSGMIFSFDDRLLRSEDFRYEIYTLPALSYIGAMETKIGLYTGIVIRDATRDPQILSFCNSYPFEYFCYEGTPRYLIRGFMEELLPRCILYPIQKTGIQGADWKQRIVNEKDQVKNALDEKFHQETEKFLSVSKVQEAKEKFLDLLPENELATYFYITYVYACFLSYTDNV